MDARARPHIEVIHADKIASVTHAEARDGKVLSIGRGPECDLVVDGRFVSFAHAYIETERDDFFLVDASANGTFLQTEDERVQYVHRGRVRLWGTGWIALGETLHACEPVLFRETL